MLYKEQRKTKSSEEESRHRQKSNVYTKRQQGNVAANMSKVVNVAKKFTGINIVAGTTKTTKEEGVAHTS